MNTLKSKSATPTITPARLRRMRKRLVAFAEDMFASLPRADQRRRGGAYLRGLLLEGKRKSIEPMAARLTAAEADGEGVRDLEQALQQFVNQSPWDPTPVRRRLAQRMTAAIRPEAWGDRRHRLPEVWPPLGRGRAPVLRGAGQGGQLPGRRVDPRRHRPSQLPPGLAAVSAPRVG
jgi:hypothetical protein